jgi:putative restriction endonuclease
MESLAPYIALTDWPWFRHLQSLSERGQLDEANFWQPRAQEPPRRLRPGDPFFFRLKAPRHAIAGFGFYASHCVLPLADAWTTFGDRNGDATWEGFHRRIVGFRAGEMAPDEIETRPIGCIALVHLTLWPESRWIPWGVERGWKPQTQVAKYESDPSRAELLHLAIATEHAEARAEFASRFELVHDDERLVVRSDTVRREGQGAFRTRLLDAYGGSCAITGEHTEPVLAAAHIQPYRGPRSNHPQNGLLLTQEFHTLFDRGYVAVTPDYKVRVSPRLRKDFGNGRRYEKHDGQLLLLPSDTAAQPSREALAWHERKLFKAG